MHYDLYNIIQESSINIYKNRKQILYIHYLQVSKCNSSICKGRSPHLLYTYVYVHNV